jgi:MFS family permease
VLVGLVTLGVLPIGAAFVVWIVAGFGMGMLYPTLSVLTLELSAEGEQGQNSSSLQVGESIFTVVVVAITGALFTMVGSGYLVSFAVAAFFGVVGILIARRSYA